MIVSILQELLQGRRCPSNVNFLRLSQQDFIQAAAGWATGIVESACIKPAAGSGGGGGIDGGDGSSSSSSSSSVTDLLHSQKNCELHVQ